MRTRSILLVLGLALAACGGGSSSSPSTTSESTTASAEPSSGAEQPLVPIGEARIGDRSTCPVSGEEFVVSESSPHVEHEGRTYYFCCPGCAQRFQADPQRFLQPQEPAAAESTPST